MRSDRFASEQQKSRSPAGRGEGAVRQGFRRNQLPGPRRRPSSPKKGSAG